MKDAFGNTLEVGDTVAFMETGYTYELKTGIVVRFTPQKLVISWDKGYIELTESYKFPKQVVRDVNRNITTDKSKE